MGDFIPVATMLLMLLPAPRAFSKFSFKVLGDAVPALCIEAVRRWPGVDGGSDGDLECAEAAEAVGAKLGRLLFSDLIPSGFVLGGFMPSGLGAILAVSEVVVINVVVESPLPIGLGATLLVSFDATVVESSPAFSLDFVVRRYVAALKISRGISAADIAIVLKSPKSAIEHADMGSVG